MKNIPFNIAEDGYVKNWLVLGPFFPDDAKADSELSRMAIEQIEPREGDIFKAENGKTLKCKRLLAKNRFVYLTDFLGDSRESFSYSFCVIQSESDCETEIKIIAGNSMKVWMNEKQIFPQQPISNNYSLPWYGFITELKLNTGLNYCFVKLFNDSPDKGFEMSIRALNPHRAVFSGIIIDEKGNPINEADVCLEQSGETVIKAKTDDVGKFKLNIYPINGSYDLSVTKEELGYRQFGLQFNENEHRELNIEMKNAVSIQGEVLMPDNSPHSAVPVQAIRLSEYDDTEILTSTKLTDIDGKYKFINLKSGRYKIRCQVMGGFVYYRHEDRMNKFQGGKGEPSILQFEYEKTINNIDFHIAPFKKGHWKKYSIIDGLAGIGVHSIYEDRDGILWFGTGGLNFIGRGVSRFDGKTFTNLTTEDGLPDDTVFAIQGDSDGKIWFGTGRTVELGGGISCYDGKSFTNFTKEKDGIVNNYIKALCRDSKGYLWFGTAKGVSCYDGKRFINFTSKDGLTHDDVYTIYCDADGILWFGTRRGITTYDGKKFSSFDVDDSLSNSPISAIHQSNDGVMWFGTLYGCISFLGGVFRYDGSKATYISIKDAARISSSLEFL